MIRQIKELEQYKENSEKQIRDKWENVKENEIHEKNSQQIENFKQGNNRIARYERINGRGKKILEIHESRTNLMEE